MTLTKPITDTIIDAMLDIWENSDRWTQGAIAKNEAGYDVSSTNPGAVQWCVVGCKQLALTQLGLAAYDEEFEFLLDYYARRETSPFGCSYTNVVSLNDNEHTTFEDVRLFIKNLKDKDLPATPTVCGCPTCIARRAGAQ